LYLQVAHSIQVSPGEDLILDDACSNRHALRVCKIRGGN
jgi:hypothetical protein